MCKCPICNSKNIILLNKDREDTSIEQFIKKRVIKYEFLCEDCTHTWNDKDETKIWDIS